MFSGNTEVVTVLVHRLPRVVDDGIDTELLLALLVHHVDELAERFTRSAVHDVEAREEPPCGRCSDSHAVLRQLVAPAFAEEDVTPLHVEHDLLLLHEGDQLLGGGVVDGAQREGNLHTARLRLGRRSSDHFRSGSGRTMLDTRRCCRHRRLHGAGPRGVRRHLVRCVDRRVLRRRLRLGDAGRRDERDEQHGHEGGQRELGRGAHERLLGRRVSQTHACILR